MRRLPIVGAACVLTVFASMVPIRAALAAPRIDGIGSAVSVPAMTDAGWSSCGGAIPWQVDTTALPPSARSRAVTDISWALSEWSSVSGLKFRFVGPTKLAFDEGTFQLATARGGEPARQMLFDFMPEASSSLLRGDVVAQAGPSVISTPGREILGGTGIFESNFMVAAPDRKARSMFLHELGHVLGLGHSSSRSDVMYPVIDGQVALGPGDVAGIKAIVRQCPAAPSPAPIATTAPVPVPTVPVPTAPVPTVPVPTVPLP